MTAGDIAATARAAAERTARVVPLSLAK